jgi:AcrR family transcriptional regulator
VFSRKCVLASATVVTDAVEVTMARARTERISRDEQRARTRRALVDACRRLIPTGQPVTIPAVAAEAGVSDATAYRHFPDLVALVNEALGGLWPTPAEALRPVATSTDPIARLDFACDFLFRRILAYQGSVRAVIAATVIRPESVRARPGFRFGLIDQALDPVVSVPTDAARRRLAVLKQDLAAVVSAEALLSLTDLALLAPEDAIASLMRTARAVTAVALAEIHADDLPE